MKSLVTSAILLLAQLSMKAAEPKITAFWIEPGAIASVARDQSAPTLEQVTIQSLRAMKNLGADTVILAYAEAGGQFYFPSSVTFFDRELQRSAEGKNCPFDVYGTVLSEADRLDLKVFLGTGRSGYTNFLMDFDKPDWPELNRHMIAVGQQVCRDLVEKFDRHPSFVGWYLTHEMADLAKGSAYYDPMADYCRSLGAHRKVLVAPTGTPIITTELLKASKVDIFAYQDAVGAGYMPYQYTYVPENRIRKLQDLYSQYEKWHKDSGKAMWAVVETWEMDGSAGYGNPYPADYRRVGRQLAAVAPHAEKISAYAWHGFLQHPEAVAEKVIPKAQDLFLGLSQRDPSGN